MAKQLHKRFFTEEVKMLLRKYLDEKVELAYILEILKIKRSRFLNAIINSIGNAGENSRVKKMQKE